MTYYNQPRHYDSPVASGRVGVDILEVRTPGYVLNEMRTVDSIVLQVASDIKKGGLKGTEFGDAFGKFYLRWKAFYDDNKSGFGGWWARGTSSVYNATVEFRNLALKWHNRLKEKGLATDIVMPSPKKEDFMRRWGGWLILGGVGLGAYFMLKMRR